MTASLLAAGAGEESPNRAPIELRFEDSLQSLAVPIRRVSAAMGGVLVGSLALHLLLLATAIVTSRVPVAPPHQEIAVDIVQDVPKPVPPKAKKPAAAKPAPAKTEPVKTQPAKVEQAKLDPPKADPPKAAPAKPESPKAQPQKAAQPTPPKADVAKAEPPKPPPPPSAAAKPTAAPQEIDKLQQELAALRAQQASLQAEAAALKQAPPQEPTSQGGGPLAGSLQAIALPSVGTGDGDVAGYQELVFSQLAKAKGDGEWKGPAGTTGVRFQVDSSGHLLNAEIAATSGSALLDKEALDIVHRAAPFPAPPKDADHSFYANVNFLPPKHS